jgi:hypothetical protein
MTQFIEESDVVRHSEAGLAIGLNGRNVYQRAT